MCKVWGLPLPGFQSHWVYPEIGLEQHKPVQNKYLYPAVSHSVEKFGPIPQICAGLRPLRTDLIQEQITIFQKKINKKLIAFIELIEKI